MRNLSNWLAAATACLLIFGWVPAASAVTVNLSNFPDDNAPVPNGTVLSDQWRSIGILFDALPSPAVNPIKEDFGDPTATLFFSPDQANVTAVFTFVVPGTNTPARATSFSLRPYFNPGESAELVGLDQFDQVVDMDTVTPGDIGGGNQSITMAITGLFDRVEWRTHGDPGISAEDITFQLEGSRSQPTPTPVPALGQVTLLGLTLLVMLAAAVRYRRKSG